LSRLCSTVRSLANDRSFAEAQSHIAKLESEHQRVRDAIAALQRSTSDAAE